MAAVVDAAVPAIPAVPGASCEHKAEIGCMLTALPSCCACADRRPMAVAYPVYIDGEGMKNTGKRWQKYCWKCRDYFNHQLEATSVSLSTSRQNSPSLAPTTMAHLGNFRGRRDFQPTASMSPSTLQDRMTAHLSAARIDGHASEPTNGIHHQTTDHNESPGQTQRLEPVYPLGSREEVQNDDYQSPIATMFGRAWGGFRIAEEVRQAERAMNPEAPEFNYNPTPGTLQRVNFYPIGESPEREPNALDRRAQHAENARPAGFTPHAGHQYPTPFFQGPSSFLSAPTEHPTQVNSRQYVASGGIQNVMYANPFVRPPREAREQSDEMEYEDNDEFDGLQPSAIDRQIQRPEPLSEEQKLANIACKICGEQKIDTLTEPCMHVATCHWCAAIWEREFRQHRRDNPHAKHRCIVCRKPVQNMRRVYLS